MRVTHQTMCAGLTLLPEIHSRNDDGCKLNIERLTETYYHSAAALPQLRCPDNTMN